MATRTRYAPDRGLTVRMTATMFFLGLVFVAFVAALIGILVATKQSAGLIVFVHRPSLLCAGPMVPRVFSSGLPAYLNIFF